jgi:hypothetical protein
MREATQKKRIGVSAFGRPIIVIVLELVLEFSFLLVPSIAAFQIANRNLKTLLRSKIEDEDENDYD